jgi:hypothetical protein
MDAGQNISAGHEHLPRRVSHTNGRDDDSKEHTLSNAVLQARGCVATKIGLADIFSCPIIMNGKYWWGLKGLYSKYHFKCLLHKF